MPGLNIDPSALPAAVMPLIGLRWALLGDSLVLVAPVADPSGIRLLYRSGGISDGVYQATLGGDSIRAVLSNKSSVALSPDAGGTITWTSSDRSVVLKAPLRRAVER